MKRIWIRGYGREGNWVDGHWRKTGDLTKAIQQLVKTDNAAVQLPDGVEVTRAAQHQGGYVVTGGADSSPEFVDSPKDAAVRALNRSARNTNPRSLGGERKFNTYTAAAKVERAKERRAKKGGSAEPPEPTPRPVGRQTWTKSGGVYSKDGWSIRPPAGSSRRGGKTRSDKTWRIYNEKGLYVNQASSLTRAKELADQHQKQNEPDPRPLPGPLPTKKFPKPYSDEPLTVGDLTEVTMGRENNQAKVLKIEADFIDIQVVGGLGAADMRIRVKNPKFTKAGRLRVPEGAGAPPGGDKEPPKPDHLPSVYLDPMTGFGENIPAMPTNRLNALLAGLERLGSRNDRAERNLQNLQAERDKRVAKRSAPKPKPYVDPIEGLEGPDRARLRDLRDRYKKPSGPSQAKSYRESIERLETKGQAALAAGSAPKKQSAKDPAQARRIRAARRRVKKLQAEGATQARIDKAEAKLAELEGALPGPGLPSKRAKPVAELRPKFRSKNVPRKAVEDVFSKMLDIHGLPPGLYPISVENIRAGSRTLGRYWAGSSRIGLQRGASEVTIAHEMGHWLDNTHLAGGSSLSGSAVVGFSASYSSEIQPTPELRTLMRAVTSSQAAKTLRETLARGTITVPIPSTGQSYTRTADRKWVTYLLTERELFARAYAQYVSQKMDKPELDRKLEQASASQTPTQWSREDFNPIEEAFDKLFASKGWK